MTHNQHNQDFDLFSPRRATKDDLYPDIDSASLENNLYPPYGSPEKDLYPEQRRTKQEWEEIKDFAEQQDLDPVDKRRVINYYLDIDAQQKK